VRAHVKKNACGLGSSRVGGCGLRVTRMLRPKRWNLHVHVFVCACVYTYLYGIDQDLILVMAVYSRRNTRSAFMSKARRAGAYVPTVFVKPQSMYTS